MIAFIKEQGAYIQKDLSDIQLVDWFKDHSTPIPQPDAFSGDPFSEKDGRTVDEDIILRGACDFKLDDDPEGFLWVLSGMTLDRDMERMDPTGWLLKEYRKNPVVFFGHDSWIPAIGAMKNVKKPDDEKGQLTGRVFFDETGTDPFAMMIANKVRSGILTKGSVGFRAKKIEILEGSRDGTRLIYREQELMEFSIVNIPSNPRAQVQRSWGGWNSLTGPFDPKVVLQEPDADPKNYVELLMQEDEGGETSHPGETSRIESLFENSPALSGEDHK